MSIGPTNEWSIFKGFLSFQVSSRFPHGLSIKILDDSNDIHRHGCAICLGDIEVTGPSSKAALSGWSQERNTVTSWCFQELKGELLSQASRQCPF